MGKIYEIGFTYSGSVQVPTVDDTTGTGSFTMHADGVYQSTLPLFSIRPGWRIDHANQRFPGSGGGPDEILRFSDTSISRKTMNMWLRFTGSAWQGMPWGEQEYGDHSQGWIMFNGGAQAGLNFVIDGWSGDVTADSTLIIPLAQLDTSTWYMLTVIVDRVAGEVVTFFNGEEEETITDLPTNAGGQRYIGSSRFSGRTGMELGLLQVFDHRLSTLEIENLYSTGMVDTTTQQPFATLIGKVYDESRVVISGARVNIFNEVSEQLESISTTSSGGDYTAYFPTIGEYSLSSTTSGVDGGRAFNVTVTSGGITVHD